MPKKEPYLKSVQNRLSQLSRKKRFGSGLWVSFMTKTKPFRIAPEKRACAA